MHCIPAGSLPPAPESPFECNYRRCVNAVLKLDLRFETAGCNAGRRIQTAPQRHSVRPLCVPFVFRCAISVQRQRLVESSEDKNPAFLESRLSGQDHEAVTGLCRSSASSSAAPLQNQNRKCDTHHRENADKTHWLITTGRSLVHMN